MKGIMMKIKIIILFIILSFFRLAHTQDFIVPESAAFDSTTGCYYISNYGNGNIIQINPNGEKALFEEKLHKSLGIILNQNILYVVENPQTVRGFNLSDGTETLKVIIHEALFLNDITCDDKGFLYVTDSRLNTVFKINPVERNYVPFVKTRVDDPNGILFDKWNNRLIVCYFTENAPIDGISLADTAVTILVRGGLNNLDGLTQDKSGSIYVSSWGPGSFQTGFKNLGAVYRFDNQFTQGPEIVSDSLYGPADIYFNINRDELVIPLFLKNDVKFLQIP